LTIPKSWSSKLLFVILVVRRFKTHPTTLNKRLIPAILDGADKTYLATKLKRGKRSLRSFQNINGPEIALSYSQVSEFFGLPNLVVEIGRKLTDQRKTK